MAIDRRIRQLLIGKLWAYLVGLPFLMVSCSPFSNFKKSESLKEKPVLPRVILLIGDGMGPQQIGFLSLYLKSKGRTSHIDELINESSLALTLPTPYPHGLIIDSGCAATQIATGSSCYPEAIGIDAEGESNESIVAVAQKRGLKTGLVSDTRITHATPAAFYAHEKNRDQEDRIAKQAVEHGADVMFSGGKNYFLPQEVAFSKRNDNQDLLKEFTNKGCQVVFDSIALSALSQASCALGLFSGSGMNNALDERMKPLDQPSLTTISLKALELLDAPQRGFFLMIEGGQIDWAGHANDAGWLLAEMQRFDETVGRVHAWAKEHPGTAIILTADHETGGFGLSYLAGSKKGKKPIDYLSEKVFRPLENQKRTIGQAVGIAKKQKTTDKERAFFKALFDDSKSNQKLYKGKSKTHYLKGQWSTQSPKTKALYEPDSLEEATVAHLLGVTAGITWATGGHTHTPIITAVWPETLRSFPRSKVNSHRDTHKLLRSLVCSGHC